MYMYFMCVAYKSGVESSFIAGYVQWILRYHNGSVFD